MSRTIHHLLVADEAFLVVAWMHHSNPAREDFSIAELLECARTLRIGGELRPGVAIHIRQHAVANKRPNPGNYRMLFETVPGRRRLLRPGDAVASGRTGKIFPDPHDLTEEWRWLVEWAQLRYEGAGSEDSLVSLRGSGTRIWADEPTDAYVSRLREGWQ